MKLYNIYESLILENKTARINQAINDRKAVNINYTDAKGETGNRYGMIYAVGPNNKGDEIIRFYQASGDGNSGEWKTLRTSRINSINVSNFKFYKPPNEIKGGQDIKPYPGQYGLGKDGSMSNVKNYVDFNNNIEYKK